MSEFENEIKYSNGRGQTRHFNPRTNGLTQSINVRSLPLSLLFCQTLQGGFMKVNLIELLLGNAKGFLAYVDLPVGLSITGSLVLSSKL
jgi:hypothetical protein